MPIWTIPQADGTSKYVDDNGRVYAADELRSMQGQSFSSKVSGFFDSAASSIGTVLGNLTNTDEESRREQTSRLISSYYDVYGRNSADNAALTAEAGRILNVNPDTFVGSSTQIQQSAQQMAQLQLNSPADWNQFVVDYPKTAEFLSRPSNMSLSHDDIANLSNQESITDVMSSAYQYNALNQERAQIGVNLLDSVSGLDKLNDDQRQRLEEINKQMEALQAKLPKSTWSIPGVLAGIVGMAPSLETGVKYGAAGAAAGAALGSLGAGAGAIPGAFAGLSQGFRVGFAKDFATTSAGNSYLNQLLSGNTPENAAKNAAFSGVGNAVLGSVQIGKILGIPEAAETGLKSLGLNVLEQGAIGSGIAAVEVAGQKAATGNTFNWNQQDLAQIAEGGVNMIPIALAMALPGYGYVALKHLGDTVDISKTAQRTPELVAEKINNEVSGTPLENVSIPGRELYNYIQQIAEQNPKEAQQIITRLNIDPEEIKEAVATGGDVSVKLGDFEVLPKQHREALLQDAKVGEQPSYRETEEAYSRQPEESTEQQADNTMAKDIGLDENKFYSEATNEAKQHSETVLSAREKAEQSPLFQKKLNDHLEEVKKEVETQIDSQPVYQASRDLQLNLQMFASKMKNVKEVAQKYLDDKLTDNQKAWVDTIADQYGFTSGHELSQKIRNNRLRDDEVKTRLDYAAEQFKREELGDRSEVDAEANISEAQVKKTASESSALRGLASGEHRQVAREKAIADAVSKFKDAEARLLVDIQKAKGDAKIAELKNQLSELQKQHNEEVKQLQKNEAYTARWYEAEANKNAKDLKDQQKRDWQMAKDWLNSEQTSQRIARQSQLGIKAAMEYAKSKLADKPINEAIAYGKYMKQARNAARQSEKEYRAGKYEAAADWKDTEMINHAMALEAMKINKDFAKQDKYIKTVQAKRKDLFKTDENFNQVGALMDRFGIGRSDYSPNAKTETLSQWSTRMDDMLGSVNIAEWVYDESVRKGYKDLTMSELKDVTDALKNIQKVANQEKTSIAVKKGESLSKMIVDQVNMISIQEQTYKPKMEPGRFEAVKNVVSNYLYQLQNFSTIISRLQGWKTFGLLEDTWIRPVHERANLESNRINQFKAELEGIWSVYSAKERKSMANNQVYYDELGASTTKMKLMAMALNLGNAGNSSKLFGTRPIGVDGTKPWNQQVVMDLLAKTLDKRDWQTVQKIWDTVNSIWPDLSKFHAEMTGFEPKKVEASPFDVVLPNGEIISMMGGYYPLKQDPQASLIAAARESADSPLYTEQNPAWKATTKTGATKQRTNAQYAIDLDISLINQHITDVVHDLYFRDLVSDYRRMLNNKEFQSAIFTRLGPNGLKAFSDYISNIANGEAYRNVGITGLEKIVDYLRKAGTKAAILFRIGVITQNAANMVLYPKAVEGFGTIDAAMGMIKHGAFNYLPKSAFNWKQAKQVREEIYSLSPYMRDRRSSPDYTLNELHRDSFGNGSAVSEFGIGLLSGSDDLIAVPMWKQAYEKELGKTGDSKQAAYYADSLIKAVNGSGRKYDVSPIIRSKKTLYKIFSSFYSFFNTEFNRWVKETGIASQGIENIPRFVGFAASRMVLFTIVSDLLSGKGPDDKDDPAAYWAGRIISYPTQLFPIVRDVAPVILDSALGVHSYGYRPPIAFTQMEAISNAALKTRSYLYGSGKTNEQDVVESIAKAAAYTAGYSDQVNAWFFNLYDYYANGMDPELEDLMRRRPKKERNN